MGAARNPTQGKLGPNWEGPYRIMSWQRKGTYHLKTLDRQKLPHPWNTELYSSVLFFTSVFVTIPFFLLSPKGRIVFLFKNYFFFYVCMEIRGVYSKMAEVSIYKLIVHKKWTTLSSQKVDNY